MAKPMIDTADITAKCAQASDMVAEKIGPKGPDLARQARKAGRRLPNAIRADLRRLAEAKGLSAHPKLSRQIDPKAVDAAFTRTIEYLKEIDPADRRKGALLSWLGDNAVNLLVVFATTIALLSWRGLI